MKVRLLQTFILGVAITLWMATAPNALPRPFTVVQWSDIHYGNEAYEPKAWEQACREGLAEHPGMVVLSGDQVDNKCDRVEFDRREDAFLSVLSSRLTRAGMPFLIAWGNNDVSSNYDTSPQILSDTLAHYRKHFGSAIYFDDLGNGVYPSDVGGVRWISINSVVFSDRDHYAGRQQQEDRTIEWLSHQLAHLPPRQPVVMVMHVPPVKEILEGREAWPPAYIDRLATLLDRYPNPFRILAGHFHRNEIHALILPSGRAVPVLLAGSLSGKFGGSPNWRLLGWTPGSTDLDYKIRYPGHREWESHYTLSHLDEAATYDAIRNRLESDDAYYKKYVADFYARNLTWPGWAEVPKIRTDLQDQIVERAGRD